MKKNYLICAVLAVVMVISPLVTMQGGAPPASNSVEAANDEDDGLISVMLTASGKVKEMSEREYLIGALAAEMNITFHEEALKAQALACRTYCKYVEQSGNAQLNGADISDDSSTHQGYLGADERKKKWGEKFEEYELKAGKAVDSVIDKLITYDGKPILAAYHNLSNGVTQSAATVWGKDIPYLQSVQSHGDKLSPDYSDTIVLSLSEFMSRAIKIEGVKAPEKGEKWIGKLEKTEDGYVKSIAVGGKTVSGSDFRKAFGLKSCVFTLDEGDSFTVKTLGNGHMVGMSQYGADYMARQGSNWQEIIKYYYKDVEIS